MSLGDDTLFKDSSALTTYESLKNSNPCKEWNTFSGVVGQWSSIESQKSHAVTNVVIFQKLIINFNISEYNYQPYSFMKLQ